MSEVKQKPRCECELFVEKYYGLPTNIPIEHPMHVTYADLVNLLAMFKEELSLPPAPKQD